MKILIDTNVLLHPHLGEQLLRKLIEEEMIPVVTDYILDEVAWNIEERYPDPRQRKMALDTLLRILQLGGEIKPWQEYAPHLEEALHLIIAKDAPVLAAAMLPDIDLLITLDTRHFLNNPRLQNTTWKEKIKRPKEFLKRI